MAFLLTRVTCNLPLCLGELLNTTHSLQTKSSSAAVNRAFNDTVHRVFNDTVKEVTLAPHNKERREIQVREYEREFEGEKERD